MRAGGRAPIDRASFEVIELPFSARSVDLVGRRKAKGRPRLVRVNAANAQAQQIANSPEVQMAGRILAGVAGIAAVSALLYDWCTTDSGQAWTSIDFEGGSSIDSKKNAPRYGKDASLTTVAPTTATEPTTSPVNESK